jgi:hypothetical protein
LEDEKVDCKNTQCSKDLDDARNIQVRVSCSHFQAALACQKCGRVHFTNGEPVFNRRGHLVFLEGQELVNRDEDGVEDSRCELGT